MLISNLWAQQLMRAVAMPPFGLYQVPRNHLYGGRRAVKPKIYNTSDFQKESEKVDSTKTETPSKMDGAADVTPTADAKKKAEKAAKKEKKRLSLSADKNSELEKVLKGSVKATAGDTPSTVPKNEQKKRRRSEGVKSSYSTPAPHPSDKKEHKRLEKKRKRESEVDTDAANSQLLHEAYIASQNLLPDGLDSSPSLPTPQEQKKQTVAATPSSTKTTMTQRKSEDGTDIPKAKKPRRKSETAVPAKQQSMVEHTPTPCEGLSGSAVKKVKKQKVSQSAVKHTDAPSTPKSSRPITKTPIPFPPLLSKTSKAAGGIQKETVGNSPPASEMLIPETPPQIVLGKALLPIPTSEKSNPASTTPKKSKKEQKVVVSSSPELGVRIPAVSTAPPALPSSRTSAKLPSIPNALTDANLRSFKEPLNEISKSRPQTRSGVSTGTSAATSSGSMSIKDAFARIGKPYNRSAAENDPFSASDDKPKRSSQSRDEASIDVFNEKYKTVVRAVDWVSEAQYLDKYLEWDAIHKAAEVACLHKMTGCTAKKEELIRRSKEQDMAVLAHLDTSDEDHTKFEVATSQAERAEDLLMLATKARVPVPIGSISGRWTLYCPTYAKSHYDKYGYGAREMVISTIAGFRSPMYTARLQLPPRTMSFTILTFEVPPHASFRTTRVKTASEGYTMEMVFLGNGYLHLRLDLGLMLQGKAGGKEEGAGVMEFVAVHERAMVWFAKEDGEPLDEEAKRLFRKYDGE